MFLQINKLIEKDQICGYQRQGLGERENWMKIVKRYKLPVIR